MIAIEQRFALRDSHYSRVALECSMPDDDPVPYIRNTPNVVFSIGALRLADSPSASTLRVSSGSITPSSHSRALA